MFDWYDKHFKDIVLEPVEPPATGTKIYGETGVIRTTDPAVLKRLQKRLKNPHVIAVTHSADQIGLRSVKSVTVKVTLAELK